MEGAAEASVEEVGWVDGAQVLEDSLGVHHPAPAGDEAVHLGADTPG